MDVVVEENCSICGDGAPLSAGVFADATGGRVRWASWTCGHTWTSVPPVVERKRGTASTLYRMLEAAGGFRRHQPIAASPK